MTKESCLRSPHSRPPIATKSIINLKLELCSLIPSSNRDLFYERHVLCQTRSKTIRYIESLHKINGENNHCMSKVCDGISERHRSLNIL